MIGPREYPFTVKNHFIAEWELNLAYIEAGEGETLLFVHGLASYLPVWTKNLEGLHKYYQCLALDLPGHGLSTSGDYPYDIPFYAGVLEKFIQEKVPGKVVLIGHSMGGQISLYYALRNPEKLSHLVLVAPAGFETFSPAEQLVLKQFATSGIMGSSQYLKILLNLKNYFHRLSKEEYAKLQEFSRDFYSRADNPGLGRILSRSLKGMMDYPVFQDLPNLRLPTLVFFGKKDNLIPNRLLHQESTENLARRCTDRIPGARLELWEDCGHFLQYEAPSRFNIALYKFLNPRIFGA